MLWPWKKREAGHLRAGRWGERQARRMLAAKGYRILGRRVRVGRRGELDIVARNGDTLVFVEVKTRRNEDFGRPIDAVDRAKQRRLSRAALGYLRRLRQRPLYFRFDVVEVIGQAGRGAPEIRHVEHAFALDSDYRVPW